MTPVTPEGRALVYVFGLISIIIFGAILGMAGLITSAIADDFLVRLNLRWLTTPWTSCLLWCLTYYAWMLVTAAVVMVWKHERLQDASFSFGNGYWFAFISS